MKIGFIGAGNMCQALISGWLENKTFKPEEVYVSNRTPGKVKRLVEQFGVNGCANNEEVVDVCDTVILSMKPQDLTMAIEPIASSFMPTQTVVSLAAGYRLASLRKILPQCTMMVRVIPNTPVRVKKGVIGFSTAKSDIGIDRFVERIFSPLGEVIKVDEGEQLQALMVACSSGVGFIFELMVYWQEWLEERGIDPELAKKMTVQTFVGASNLAEASEGQSLVDLQHRVASKKGVTAAGLDSMRELEVERALRYSFEKSALKDREIEGQN
jgi:pyrroline-5-carboxylate reductase